MTTKSVAKRSRASPEQLSHLVDFMVQNPALAGGNFRKMHGKLECKKKWTQLKEMLNCLGGTKTAEQWHTVWRDLKSRTSIKVREWKKEQALTTNKHIGEEPLTELERKIIGTIESQYIEVHECSAENDIKEENLEGRLEDFDEITFPLTPRKSTDLFCESLSSSASRTHESSKRKRVDSENDTELKILDIVDKQADALKVLAECNAANMQGYEMIAEALKGIGEGLKANTDAMNNVASALNNFLATDNDSCLGLLTTPVKRSSRSAGAEDVKSPVKK